MNNLEMKEIHKLECFHAVGVDAAVLARRLSALIRASMTRRSRAALMAYADIFEVRQHPEFII